MTFTRVRRTAIWMLVTAIAATLLVLTPPPVPVAASSSPPFCRGNATDAQFVLPGGGPLCPGDGGSDELDVLITGSTSGGSATIAPNIAKCTQQDPVTDVFSPSPCYSAVDFSFTNSLLCAYIDTYAGRGNPSPFASQIVPCNFFPSDHTGPIFGNYIYETISWPEPGRDLGLFRTYSETGRGQGDICRSRFDENYVSGAPGGEWTAGLTCSWPIAAQRPVEGLLGETWIAINATLTVEDVGPGGPFSYSAADRGWIEVDGSERARRPIVDADREKEGFGLVNCNKWRLVDTTRSHRDNPVSYEWDVEIAREVGGSYEYWGTYGSAEPVIQFPPAVAVIATLTVTDDVNGLTDTDQTGMVLDPSCGGPDDPPGVVPVVTIEATDPVASEPGTDRGEWTLKRTGPTLGPLAVNVSVSGTASEGSDYRAVNKTVTFPAGVDEVTIVLLPLDDSIAEPSETATMTVQPGPGYTPGDPDEADIVIFSDETGGGAPSAPGVSPLTPARLADTRPGQPTVDAQVAGVGPVQAGTSLRVPVRGRGGVPSSATAVVVNAVAVGPTGPGFLAMYPCDEDVPSTSSVNYGSRPVDVNGSLVKLSADGALCVFSSATTDVVLDVTAFAQGDEALSPKRLAESRPGLETTDGQSAGFGRVAPGSVTEIQVTGRGGVPVDAAAVAVNVTAVVPAGPGFLTLFPCDEDRPNASNLNYGPGEVRPNAAVVALSATGKLCVFSSAATDMIVDVSASFPTAPGFVPLNPARLLETRAGLETVDGQSQAIGRLAAGSTTTLQVAGRGGVPAGARSAAVNLAVILPSDPGFITLYPCGEDQPTASSANYVAGDVIANSGIVKLDPNGAVCIFTSAATDLVIDVNAAWTTT
jgi:hypothetical protein